jgi:hypothetical protein
MLVFVDESYRKATEVNPKSTFSAFLIREQRYRELDSKLFELKRHFWKCEHSYDLELKGRELLSEHAIELPKNREFVSQLIFLCKEVDCVLFAVVQSGTLTLASDSDKLPSLYRALIRRVNTFMQEKLPDDRAAFFFDGIDHKTNRKVAISFNNFMQKHHWGKACVHVIPTPFFCDSLVSPGVQVADVVAYCVNERYVGRRGYLEDYFKRFRELAFTYENPDEGFNMWGFAMIPPEEFPVEEVEKENETGDF